MEEADIWLVSALPSELPMLARPMRPGAPVPWYQVGEDCCAAATPTAAVNFFVHACSTSSAIA